ncbi:hypothetical protein SKAU_G00390070 [Synaphobranchus kaupii]|uniref:Uncharacterized protein n=1 Tax=Synaphobranchus kaupii TaxID=118154 RepID=A0A9Q1EBA9_SYNKA|nr:hypothetical protein SKAU_G00390070 [Synaphobranchus kaupii]
MKMGVSTSAHCEMRGRYSMLTCPANTVALSIGAVSREEKPSASGWKSGRVKVNVAAVASQAGAVTDADPLPPQYLPATPYRGALLTPDFSSAYAPFSSLCVFNYTSPPSLTGDRRVLYEKGFARRRLVTQRAIYSPSVRPCCVLSGPLPPTAISDPIESSGSAHPSSHQLLTSWAER